MTGPLLFVERGMEMQLLPRRALTKRERFVSFAVILVLMFAAFSYTISLRNALDGLKPKRVVVPDAVTTIDFSQDGALTYLGLRDKGVLALDENDSVAWQFPIKGRVLDLKAEGDHIYVGVDDRKLYILDRQGQLVNSIRASYRPISVAGNATARRVIVSSSLSAMKNRLELFDFNGEKLFSINLYDTVFDVFMLPGGEEAIYVTRGAEVHRINAAGEKIASNGLEYYPVDSAYSPSENMLVVSDEGNNVYAFTDDMELLWKKKLDSKINAVDIDGQHRRIVVASDAGYLITLGLDGSLDTQLNSAAGIRMVRVNQAAGTLYTLKDDSDLRRYRVEALTDFSRMQYLMGRIRVIDIILLVLMVVTAMNLSPRISSAVWGKLARGLRVLRRARLSYMLLLPTIFLLLAFNYYPAVSGLFIAFTDYKPGIYMRWVGLTNFINMLHNEYFWVGVWNMVIFLITDLIKVLVPSILFAELILAMRSKAAQYWTRVALYLPGILPGIAGLLIWTDGILGMNGIINQFLRAVGLGNLATPWLGNSKTALGALIFIGFPWVGAYIIFYGALISIPNSLFEAAKIDGCSWWKRILTIDVPLISPQIKFVFVTSFIASVQNFGRVYVTTMGGPGHSTYIPILELFYNMSKFTNYGEAAAMGLFLFIVVFGATLMNLRMKTVSQ